jgi:hypothetical protein
VGDRIVTQPEHAVHRTLATEWRDYLDTPITAEELQAVVRKGACNIAPERDGICLEFLKINLKSIKDDMLAIFNQMYLDGRIMGRQKHGIIVYIPKTNSPSTPADYRPLLNTDYKILALIMSNRTRPTLCEVLHQRQYSGVPGNTIFDAMTTVRDAIAYAELTLVSLCILSFDLTAAFFRILHTHLFRLLQSYGYSTSFIALINAMHDEAFSSIQINGYVSEPLPTRCSVRQGCPMNILIFAMILNPLPCLVERKLTGIRLDSNTQQGPGLAYVDDITIFVTVPKYLNVIRDLVLTYEKARGACVKIRKSKAIAVES